MNINRQPAATLLMIYIKHQPDTVLVDDCRKKKLYTSTNDLVQSKIIKLEFLFLESTYP